MSLSRKIAERSGAYFRARRIAPLVAMIEAVYREHGQVRIIDIGGRPEYWQMVPDAALDKYKVEITAVNPEAWAPTRDYGRFKFLSADGCDLSRFADNSFHIAHSNSVIEHVGSWERMQRFAAEVARVAPRYFVQTPNFWFPMEPHTMTPFFHWMPVPVKLWLVSRFQLGYWKKANNREEAIKTIQRASLLTRRQMQVLFPESHIITEWFFVLPKSFMAVKSA